MPYAGRAMGRTHRLSLPSAVAASMLLITVSASEGLTAEPVDDRLEAGPWTASAFARGKVQIKGQGIKVVWQLEIPAQFDFRITGTGKAIGTWRHQGSVDQVLTGRFRGRKVKGRADLALKGGGKVRGSGKKLRLNGSSRHEGDLVLTSPQGSVAFDVSQNSKIPTLRMPVIATTCDEAYGEWAYTLKQALDEQGLKGSVTGTWLAFRDTSEFRAKAKALRDSVKGGNVDTDLDSSLLVIATELIISYNQLARRYPDWPADEVSDLFKETESILNALRNLSECERTLVGEGTLERYVNALTGALQNLIVFGGAADGTTAGPLQTLVQSAIRAGAIGPGAPNPAMAVKAEDALVEMAEEVLDANLDPEDGTVLANDETRMVIATAAGPGWTLSAGDAMIDARELMGISMLATTSTP